MLPFANPVALAQSQRGLRMSGDSWTEEKNLNRQFPGNSNGILAERIAHTIFSYFKKAHVDLVVDLHTMHTRSIHMAILDRIPTRKETFDTALNHANKTGLPVVYDYPLESYAKESLDGSLSATFMNAGIPSFTIEVPGGPFSQHKAEQTIYMALGNLHEKLGLTLPETEKKFAHSFVFSKLELGCLRYARMRGPIANRAGFFRPMVSIGEVEKDRIIGKIVDETSTTVETITMPFDGYVSDIIDASVVTTGDMLFEFLVSK